LATQQYYLDTKTETDTYWSGIKETYQGTTDLSNLLSHKVDLTKVKSIEAPAEQVLSVQGQAYAQLKSMCQTQGITLNVALQFAWHKLLQSYSGDNQTIVGTTVSGRDVPVEGIESSVGLYINTLPLMVDWEQEDLTVAAVLQGIQRDIAALNSHSAVSLASLQQDGERLFHSLFVFENYPVPDMNEDNRGIESSLAFRQSVEKVDYPLSVIAFEQGESLIVKLGFSEDWLNSQDGARLLKQLERILSSIAAEPEQHCQSLSFISTTERDTLLHDFNDTDAPYPRDKTLHQLFDEQVAKTPNNIALVFEGVQLTYAELNEKANQLAHAIRQTYLDTCGHELKADTLIPLYLDRSLEMVISILAVLKAGGAYVPISPEYPAERTQFILTDTTAKLVVTQSQHLATLEALSDGANKGISHSVSLLAADLPSIYEDRPTEAPISISTANDLAYVIYTSGTTGKPKGVMVEHHNVVHLVKALVQRFNVQVKEKALLFLAYVFDASVSEFFVSLLSGQTGYLCSESERNAIGVTKLIQREDINVASFPSVMLNQLSPDDFTSLKTVISGGDSPSLGLLTSFGQHCQVFNAYGPTEITVCATANEYQTGDSANNIGTGVNNTQLYVLDERLALMPLGASGELYIGGAGLARGYLNRPELTKACFIDNLFATEDDIKKGYTRLYKTGDLVRYLADGNLEYLGRNDSQVKIRGYRIELGEIETALSSLDSVKQAVVIDREREGNKYLAAYIVLHGQSVNEQAANGQALDNEKALDTDRLIASLTQALPEFMVPATFTIIDAIPLTINGKLDRRALPEPAWVSVDNYTAPRNALETQLCEIWQSVLGLERVGIHDNFFRSGGDSITAMKLVAVIRRELSVDIPLSTFFSRPQIALCCDWLTKGTCQYDLLKILTPESSAKQMLFMIHPASAGCEVYVPLASTLSTEFNCIGIDNYNYHSGIQVSSFGVFQDSWHCLP
jgi:amino acid adenylation domain-containing protein